MTAIPRHVLSKSTFIKGTQCVKALYLNKHHRELKEDISEQLEQVFATGHQVGELAQDLFPGGDYGALPGEIPSAISVQRTMDLIANGCMIIYEATFQFEEVMVAMDIMVKHKDGWHAYEVKSATSVKGTFRMDASVQYYVITNSGCKLKDIAIVHINTGYVKQGPIDVQKLFTIASVLPQALENQTFVESKIKEFKNILASSTIPEVEIGPHCSDPYGCDFTEHCWQHIPKQTLFSYKGLRGKEKWDLFKSNIYKIDDIPDNYPLGKAGQVVVSAEKNNREYINKASIRSFVADIHYPIYYLDFETLFMVTIPIYDNSSPFQQIPFQYSLHIRRSKNAELEHYEYLAEANRNIDPRIAFIKQLVAEMGTEGSILAYNMSFEIGRLKELKDIAPQYTNEIDNMIARFIDLMNPFRSKHYYTPSMKGSYSIKKVLPALVPELSYEGMDIANGSDASASFMKLFNETDSETIQKTRTDLLEYCKLDTQAMVEILDVLFKI